LILFDLCGPVASIEYPMPTWDDLVETATMVEDRGSRVVARQADVRDYDAVLSVFNEGLQMLGRVDIVLANAGIAAGTDVDMARRDRQAWHDSIDIMLTGAYYTADVAVSTLIEQGTGGSIVFTSSTAGLKGMPHSLAASSPGSFGYGAAKHAVVGLMRSYARALGPYNVRVNSVHPTGVNTPMVVNDAFDRFVNNHPDVGAIMQNVLPVPMIEAQDVTNAVSWLCSDDARYVTGVALSVDAGFNLL
jgi:NAD(P)-dependent dehydrogenase (short-subunit alcohol dehydrogenase family)